jgi:hypothetical protein
MLRKMLCVVVAGLLVHVLAGAQPVAAKTKAEKQAEFTGKVKAGIAKLGTGPEARVAIKLRDKTKLTGYVGEAGEDGFVVVNPKTGEANMVAYSTVAQIKGHNLSRGGKIAIVLGIAVGVLAFLLFLENYG